MGHVAFMMSNSSERRLADIVIGRFVALKVALGPHTRAGFIRLEVCTRKRVADSELQRRTGMSETVARSVHKVSSVHKVVVKELSRPAAARARSNGSSALAHRQNADARINQPGDLAHT